MPERLSVLVVDDEERPRIFLEDLITGRGHRWVSVSSLQEARAAIAKEIFDIVVMDLTIPVLVGRAPLPEHGYALETQIRVRMPRGRTYLIVLTGQGRSAMDSSLAHDHGCDAYVLKGDRERLLTKLAEGEAQARSRRRPNQRPKARLPLEANSWQDCTILLGRPARARTRSGAETVVELSDRVEKVLYHLQFSEAGSDLSELAAASNRRSLARDARKFLRGVFDVAAGPADPVPYQRARKTWICLVELRDPDLDQASGAYEELRRRDHDTFEDAE